MKSAFKALIISLTVSISLAGCINFKKLVGLDSKIVDFPPGDYIGTAKTILAEGNNGEAATYDIKVTFLPKSADLKDGIGVLVMRNNSQRFFWRTDGDNQNSWNVLFHKDQNLYSSMSESFNFDGLISASEVRNQLEGRLHFTDNVNSEDFFIQASQIFKPEILEPKEAIEIKAGEEFEIAVAKVGKDRDAIKVFYKANEGDKNGELEISKFTINPKEGTRLGLVTTKKFTKGNYSLYLERDGQQLSNKIGFTIK